MPLARRCPYCLARGRKCSTEFTIGYDFGMQARVDMGQWWRYEVAMWLVGPDIGVVCYQPMDRELAQAIGELPA